MKSKVVIRKKAFSTEEKYYYVMHINQKFMSYANKIGGNIWPGRTNPDMNDD